MALFNIFIGIAIGAVLLVPCFWIRSKWGRCLVIMIAIGGGMITVPFSQQYIYPTYLGWQFEKEIVKQPLFSLIAQRHPKEFDQYLTNVKQNLKTKGNFQRIPIYSAQLVNQVFFEHLQNAPDENIFQYLQATLNLYQYLNLRDPRAVVKLENNDNAVNFDFNTIWQDKEFQSLLGRVLDSKRFLIESAIKTPVAAPTQAQGDPLLQSVLDDLAKKYGEESVRVMFKSSGASGLPANKHARLWIEFYQGLLAAGKEKAGIIMRYISSLKAQEG